MFQLSKHGKVIGGTFLLSIFTHIGFLGFLSFSPVFDLQIKRKPPMESEWGFIETFTPENESTEQKPSPEKITETPQKKETKNKSSEQKSEKQKTEDSEKKQNAEKQKQKKPHPQKMSESLPAGSLIGLRIHLNKIRETPLRLTAQRLLDNIPDWKAILQGSGIDPLNDLERIVIASPNLYRSQIVIAGKYKEGQTLAETAVQKLANQKQKEVTWTKQNNVRIAQWHNVDRTERFIALLDSGKFVIATKKDLPKVISLFQSEDNSDLIHLEENQLLRLEAFQLKKIIELPDSELNPQSFHIELEEHAGQIRIQAEIELEKKDASQTMLKQLLALKNHYAQNPIVLLMGMKPVLDSIEITRKNNKVHLQSTLSYSQAQKLLGYLQVTVLKNQNTASSPSAVAPSPSSPSPTVPPPSTPNDPTSEENKPTSEEKKQNPPNPTE